MNEKLKFSWGHIIAFLAIIFISYVTFVGITYLTDGNFITAIVGMIAIDVILMLFFMGAQLMKGTERKFDRCIIFERVFVFGSPVIFIITMLPYTHFWTVHHQNDEIVGEFTEAISLSKQLFVDYEQYSSGRIEKYDHMLNRVIASKQTRPSDFKNCGFANGKEWIQKENMVKTLKLQLLSENYDSLKSVATAWIESSSKGASTWNVFLLGNTKEIASAIGNWQQQLSGFTTKKLQNESFENYNEVQDFQSTSHSVTKAQEKLSNLKYEYSAFTFPNLSAIISSLLLYLMLILPYLLQDRHTKNIHRLIGMEKGYARNNSFKPSSRKPYKEKPGKRKEDVTSWSSDSYSSGSNKNQEDEEYGSFTL